MELGTQARGGNEYKRMEHRDQIRHRPETYIGSPAGITSETIWCGRFVGEGTIKFDNTTTQVALAIIGICKEAFDNVTDNVERSRIEGIDPGHAEVMVNENALCVKNYGKHIPVIVHHQEGIWVPQMIFGVLLTSDNYDDSISRYKIGRNGYGIKLTNIFSAMFNVEIADPHRGLLYKQTWTNGMSTCSAPEITQYQGPGYTQITFIPDFDYFYYRKLEGNVSKEKFMDIMQGFFQCRAAEVSFASKIPVVFNGVPMDFRDGAAFAQAHFDSVDPSRGQIHWISNDSKNEFIVIETPNAGFLHGFVNGAAVHQGEHMNEYLRYIFDELTTDFEKKHGKKVTIAHLKKHVSLILRVTVDKPEFDSQIKRKLVKPKPKLDIPKNFFKPVMKWNGLIDELKNLFGMKEKKDARLKPQRVETVEDATQANSSNPAERLKCGLIITEGETGKTLALAGCKYLPGGKDYTGVFPIRGKLMNISRHSEDKVSKNKELASILQILGAKIGIDYFNDRSKLNTLRYGKIIFMADADHDGQHIIGLGLKFIFTQLKTLAPFEFVMVFLTPVIEGTRVGERLTFYHQKQMIKWLKENDPTGWKFDYKKGLGSWDDDNATLKKLFQNPLIVTMAVDSSTDDMLKLAFDKKLENARKGWISGYNPNSEIVLTNPRPISDFFMEEFRDYSKASVVRAIPRLMDGMKVVHRKILWAALKKFKSSKVKEPKLPTFGGYVIEQCQYHHGDQALHQTIIGMGQCYKTGPNNIALLKKYGNYGTRRLRGADSSPARYLSVGLSKITRYIYRVEDDDILEMLTDDGVVVEPREMYPVICMALVNKCEGIATGWSTKIYPHNPLVVLQWQRLWVQEKKAKRHIPDDQLEMSLLDKPELVPWWREYTGSLVRIKNNPHEVYRNEGTFDVGFHTVNVRELPVEISYDAYKKWGDAMVDLYHEKPEEAQFRDFISVAPCPEIHFQVFGMSSPTVEKLNLTRTIAMSNMVLLDMDEIPKKYNFTFEILCEWCLQRLKIYAKRKANQIRKLEVKVQIAFLKYNFIMDVVEGRLELRNRPTSEVHAYMKSKGYPFGDGKRKKKSKIPGAEDQTPEEEAAEESQKDIEKKDFLAIPVRSLTMELAQKIRREWEKAVAELEYYRGVLEEDLWLKDMDELEPQIIELYKTPIQGKE